MAPDGTSVSVVDASSGDTRVARALEALYARVPLGMRLGLDAMHAACKKAGHPESAFDVVHVAGTNGKGSTSAMVESMAREAGLRTGLYTSPHLCRFGERIRIDGVPLDDRALSEILERALAIGTDLSFFETATLAAFLAFERAKVDLAVVEVGIGGRLDATNVIPTPRCAAITRIALDHTDRLGNTIEEIAREKAGIAKKGGPLVLGPLTGSARAAVLAIARDKGARIVETEAHPGAAPLGVNGAFQHDNAGVAIAIAKELGLDSAAVQRGLANVQWPGRFERLVVPSGPFAGPWLLDGAHNPDGAHALAASIAACSESERPQCLVFGALADKAWEEMLSIVRRVVKGPCFYTMPRGRTAVDPTILADAAPGTVHASLRDALMHARSATNDAPSKSRAGKSAVLVCGSLYLVGQARAVLLGLSEDPPVAL